ncbi:HET domain-containing protein [Microdochium nivale]|nr:HET domain-containing protein [Microdochium nivale]
MHLLNVHTRLLEQFLGTSRPPYAILSHTWGDHEAKFEDYCAASAHVDNGPLQPEPRLRPRYRRARTRREPGRESQRLVLNLQHRAECSRQRRRRHRGPGHAKIAACCRQAKAEGFDYVWIDTCCIDKRSSAELSEAINTMFRWYKEASCCYVFLANVPSVVTNAGWLTLGDFLSCPLGFPPSQREAFQSSRWFRRGWTLQELLAPETLQFFDTDWSFIGVVRREHSDSKWAAKFPDLTNMVSQITGIPRALFQDGQIGSVSVAQRMSWASSRETTREENMAYCLLGIFDVNMPLLYGEGLKAFERLQEEIIRTNSDQSIFVFGAIDCGTSWLSVEALLGTSQPDRQDGRKHLARSPRDFAGSSAVAISQWLPALPNKQLRHHVTTNMGISMSAQFLRLPSGEWLLPIMCTTKDPNEAKLDLTRRARVCLVVNPGPLPQSNILKHRRDGYMTLVPDEYFFSPNRELTGEKQIYLASCEERGQTFQSDRLTMTSSFLNAIHVRATFPEQNTFTYGYSPYQDLTGEVEEELYRYDIFLDCVAKNSPLGGQRPQSFALRVLLVSKREYGLEETDGYICTSLFISHQRDRCSMVDLMLQTHSYEDSQSDLAQDPSTWEKCEVATLDEYEIFLGCLEVRDSLTAGRLCIRSRNTGNPRF